VTPAHAFLIVDTGLTSGGNPGGQPIYRVEDLVQGDMFRLDWGGVAGVDAYAHVSIATLTSTQAILEVMLYNTSTPLGGDDPRLTSFGVLFDEGLGDSFIIPQDPPGDFLGNRAATNFPGFGDLVCATSDANCAGGGSGGIPAGGMDTFAIGINGTFNPTLNLSTFGLKVQGGPGGDSFELAGVPSEKVPAPAALTLVAFGLVALGALRRKRTVC
jgi:hypothetical protein